MRHSKFYLGSVSRSNSIQENILVSGSGYLGPVYKTNIADTTGSWYADETRIVWQTAGSQAAQVSTEGKQISHRSKVASATYKDAFFGPGYGHLVYWFDSVDISSIAMDCKTSNVDGWRDMKTQSTYSTISVSSHATMSHSYGNEYWNGSMQEYLIFNTLLSVPGRQKVERNNATKWNMRKKLPESHPYKLTIPLAS